MGQVVSWAGPREPVTLLNVPEGTLSTPARRSQRMAYKIAGIDVHKRMLAVVIADVERSGEWVFERRRGHRSVRAIRT